MASMRCLHAWLALAVGSATLATVAEGRLILPLGLQLHVHRLDQHRQRAAGSPVTQELIDSYFDGSGFPKAGRTLGQKIQEAEAFLAVELPKTGTIGAGVSIVYDDQVVLAKGYGLRSSADPSSAVTRDSMFQIGSVSKTHIAVEFALLVEDGKLQWRDPVKTHLPWLQLFDKYAEAHMTVGNLLSMNSGLGRQPDLALYTGQFKSEREFVAALGWGEPESSLRETPMYSNTNFEILGQVIQEVSGTTWQDFLSERLWKPLGMRHTFASARLTPAELEKSSMNAGHLVCENNVLGPYSLTSSLDTELLAGDASGLVAAGSIVSSAADMATFARFLLNKGAVGDTKLLKSAATITTMLSGKNVATGDIVETATYLGVDFSPEGGTFAAGYGFDYVGDVMWGHAYAMKGGATAVHGSDFSLAPRNGLAVVILANSQPTFSKLNLLRSHVMGIFLDVPKHVLDFQLKKRLDALAAAAASTPTFKLLPSCGVLFWKNPTRSVLTPEQSDAFVGTYTATASSKFFPTLSVARSPVANEFVVEFNAVKASYFFLGSEDTIWYFKTEDSASLLFQQLLATRSEKDGAFGINLAGVMFQKQ